MFLTHNLNQMFITCVPKITQWGASNRKSVRTRGTTTLTTPIHTTTPTIILNVVQYSPWAIYKSRTEVPMVETLSH